MLVPDGIKFHDYLAVNQNQCLLPPHSNHEFKKGFGGNLLFFLCVVPHITVCVRSLFQSVSNNVIESCTMLDAESEEWVEKSLINCYQLQVVASVSSA